MKDLHHYSRWPLTMFASALLLMGGIPSVEAANHREAPLTALDAKADITDWYAFVSYNDPSKVTMILNVDPLLEPSNGPNYFPFDPEILYEMKVDNNFDADEDITLQFRFKTENRLPGVFTGFVGAGTGIVAPANSPNPIAAGTLIVPPAITALDGPGSEGLGLRQSYTVTLIKGKGANRQVIDLTNQQKLYAVPSNVGPRTMPNYQNLASQGIYDLGGGVSVFAGTVDDPFYIDLGATFDTFNFRAGASGVGVPGVFAENQNDAENQNFASDDVAGYNVNSIAIELPIAMLTQDGKQHTAGEALAVIGTYATTSRPRTKAYADRPGGKPKLANAYVQIQRMGNPLVNEVLIGTGDKDRFSMSEPKDDASFAGYVLDPLLARVVNAAYGGAVPIPAPPRVNPANPSFDLGPLVFYAAPICPGCSPSQRGPVADLLRLNTGIGPAPVSARKRMAFLAGDSAGFPNGRRVSDDVTDIAAQAVVGVLNPAFNSFPNNRVADGVNTNDRTYQEVFPYVAFANSGRQSRHVDPGESGCFDAVSLAMGSCPNN
ncbi:DUF4331 domain-containing protein [Methylomonas sp. ZR1]|uniref:DUF4331 domain-containing protein n=1 Tax=Methylomonas sp. ZR1 TaxID=1797072 RepID=UPI0014915DFB|nr:DUF4331 domain-containing protein [Methylomonas sp. ZR1]NOV30423.1 DUF4331 domain-containing protein [Methylomonas sp. ZR1]